ncbi:hypothetical protein C8Q75DRAFT_490637 [Abortiporus biennis]|nr:hypothetical protein C8Q75DRAFT_490637 [Abortiporus biennis]
MYIQGYPDAPDTCSWSEQKAPFGFFKIMHVCRYWRDVTHWHGALWSRIILHPWDKRYREANQQMLVLSRSYPLHISINIKDDAFMKEDKESLAKELHRIQKLEVTINPEEYIMCYRCRDLWGLFQMDMPILDSITLQSNESDFAHTVPSHHSCMSSFPSLKSLETCNFALSTVLRFCRPTIIHLRLQSIHRVRLPHAREALVQVLLAVPHLQELELDHVIGIQGEADDTDFPLVQLASLKTLVVRDRLDGILWFFTILSQFPVHHACGKSKYSTGTIYSNHSLRA